MLSLEYYIGILIRWLNCLKEFNLAFRVTCGDFEQNLTTMDPESPNALDFEFAIAGGELELSDNESSSSQVASSALEAEASVLQEASIAHWRGDNVVLLQPFFEELLQELQPSCNDYLARINIVSRLRSALEHMDSFRGPTIFTFGSFESNLFTRWADLDLSLELQDRCGLLQPVGKRLKVKVLNALSKTLVRKGEALELQTIPYARVPLITFKDSKHNIWCDISVNNDSAFVKSRILRWLCEIDSRCRDLIFLVKFWAKAHDINNPKQGTFNSFALCLLVIFHLQTRFPPLLPPLCAVLDGEIGKDLRNSKNKREEFVEGYWQKFEPFIHSDYGAKNTTSVAELFVTFINQFCAVKELWSQGLAVCTFKGTWGDSSSTCGKWKSKRYTIAIEDPFDRAENCARTVQPTSFNVIVKAFTSTAEALSRPLAGQALPSLLESVHLWPRDKHALGIHKWLSEVLSKVEEQRYEQVNVNFAHVANNTSRRQPKHSMEAQFQKQLQLSNPCLPVQTQSKLMGMKVSHGLPTVTADTVVRTSNSGIDLTKQNVHDLERMDKNDTEVNKRRKSAFTRKTISRSLEPSQVAAQDGLPSGTYSKFDILSVRKDEGKDMYNFLPSHTCKGQSEKQLQSSNLYPVKKKKISKTKVGGATVDSSLRMSNPEAELRKQNNEDLLRTDKNSSSTFGTMKPAITREMSTYASLAAQGASEDSSTSETISRSLGLSQVAAEDGLPSETYNKFDILSVTKDEEKDMYNFLPSHTCKGQSEKQVQSSNLYPVKKKEISKKKVGGATVDSSLSMSNPEAELRKQNNEDLLRTDKNSSSTFGTMEPAITREMSTYASLAAQGASKDSSTSETHSEFDLLRFRKNDRKEPLQVFCPKDSLGAFSPKRLQQNSYRPPPVHQRKNGMKNDASAEVMMWVKSNRNR